MEPTTSKWPALLARLRAETDERRTRSAARRAQADVLAELLRTRFGVIRVLLFGSLARGDLAGRLDIDLAVTGLAAVDELRALAAVSDEAGCAVDLVRTEDASPRLAAAIARDGIELVAHG